MINKSKIIVLFMVLFSVALNGQMINRYGTTTANFLEIGVGSCLLYTSDAADE